MVIFWEWQLIFSAFCTHVVEQKFIFNMNKILYLIGQKTTRIEYYCRQSLFFELKIFIWKIFKYLLIQPQEQNNPPLGWWHAVVKDCGGQSVTSVLQYYDFSKSTLIRRLGRYVSMSFSQSGRLVNFFTFLQIFINFQWSPESSAKFRKTKSFAETKKKKS